MNKAFVVFFQNGKCTKIVEYNDANKARQESDAIMDAFLAAPDKTNMPKASLVFAPDKDSLGYVVGDPHSSTDDLDLVDYLD